MSCLWLGIAGALAGAPSDSVPTTDTPATEDRTAEAPMWTGGSRDQIYDIVGVEGQVKAIGSSMNELQLISAELDWGDYVTTPGATNAEDDQTGFSHSSLTVTRERVLDASLVDSVTSMTNPDTYGAPSYTLFQHCPALCPSAHRARRRHALAYLDPEQPTIRRERHDPERGLSLHPRGRGNPLSHRDDRFGARRVRNAHRDF